MNQQDLVWVKLPFSDLRQSKVRPSLVVSNNDYNKSNPDIIVCAVTSKLKESEYSVPVDNKDLAAGNLPIKSRIRADKILQVEKGLVIRPFARLGNKVFDRVADKVGKLIKRGQYLSKTGK